MEALQGLPVRLDNWIHSQIGWKQAGGCLRNILLFIVVVIVIEGIFQGLSYGIFKDNIIPWLTQTRSDLNNGLIFGLACGWCIFGITVPLLVLIYGADRRRLGQLEIVGRENAQREQEINSLISQLSGLQNQLNLTTTKLSDQAMILGEQQGKLLDTMAAIDRELLLFLTNGIINETAEFRFYESACRRLFDLFDNGSHVFRSAIYFPDSSDPNFLRIRWDHGVGMMSREFNKWYVGELDPEKIGVHRGIPGSVYVSCEGRVNVEVRDDPDFWDSHVPQRAVLPYHSVLHALIHPADKQNRCGVFCIDSLTYVFTEHDLRIVEEVAIRFGWLICGGKKVTEQQSKGGTS